MRPIIILTLVATLVCPAQVRQWQQVKDCKMEQIAVEEKIWYVRSAEHLYKYIYHDGTWYNQIVE